MAVCCKYREQDGGTAIACYDGRDECPEFDGLTLVEEKQVDTCPDEVDTCFPKAGKNGEVRVLT